MFSMWLLSVPLPYIYLAETRILPAIHKSHNVGFLCWIKKKS